MLISIKIVARKKCQEQCLTETCPQTFVKQESEYFYLSIKQNSVHQGFSKFQENFMPLIDCCVNKRPQKIHVSLNNNSELKPEIKVSTWKHTNKT